MAVEEVSEETDKRENHTEEQETTATDKEERKNDSGEKKSVSEQKTSIVVEQTGKTPEQEQHENNNNHLENVQEASIVEKQTDKTPEEKPNNEKNNIESINVNDVQIIKISNFSNNLTLKDGKDTKEETLLSDSKTVVRFSPVWKQSLTALSTILLSFTAGLTSGYSAILLPQLKNGGGDIPYDESTASWIAAIAALPMAPGCLLSGWMLEKFGRKNSHYIICAPFLLGWILIACAKNLTLMLIGRFFTGSCVGLLGPLGPVYIAEISEPKYRGFFLAGVSLAIAVGILVAHIIGTFMTWQWTAIICCLFPVVSAVVLILVPESPTWLISKGKIEDGIKSFYWLRGYSEEAKTELKGILDKKKAVDSEPVPNWREKITILKSPELLKPLFIMIIFFCTCQFSGVNAVAFYSIEIVEKAVGKGIDHYLAMLLIDSLRVLMSIVACVVCKQYGRRLLCVISGIWTALSMVGLSMFLYWKPENMSWLPLTCLMFYICAISIGLVPLPWIMCGEVFPTNVRGLGSGISSATTFVAFFVVVKTAPGMMTHLGEVITFLLYGIVSFVGTVILYFILPETKGKSLQEIEEKFRNGKKSNQNV